MSRKRCCCAEVSYATDCNQSQPSPVSPCTFPKWRVSAFAYGMKAAQWGSGQHTFSDGGCLDCQKGTCTLVAAHEGSVDVPDPYAEGDCITDESLAEMCQKYADGAATIPQYDGYHIIEFKNDTIDAANIISEDQSDVVYIASVQRCRSFDGCSNANQPGKFSTVTVDYVFYHVYNGWSLNLTNGECVWTRPSFVISQTWRAIYQRRLLSSEYWASGKYKLVRVISPISGDSSAFDPGCLVSACPTPAPYYPLEYCSPGWGVNVDYQGFTFPWKPPDEVELVRIC